LCASKEVTPLKRGLAATTKNMEQCFQDSIDDFASLFPGFQLVCVFGWFLKVSTGGLLTSDLTRPQETLAKIAAEISSAPAVMA
jgi:hypothetical protein